MNSADNSRAELARLVGAIARTDGDYGSAIASLKFYRRSAVSDTMPCIYGLGLGMALQGDKRVAVGDALYDYGPGQSLLTSIDLPVVSYVTRASASEPYLGLWLDLDARRVAQVAAGMHLPRSASARAVSVAGLDHALAEALIRMLRLLDEPLMTAQIAPLIEQEIIIRLLSGAHGPTLRHLMTAGSPGQQIARVIQWLRHGRPIDQRREARAIIVA